MNAPLAGIYNTHTPNWQPLKRALGIALEGNVEAPEVDEAMGDYMWMCEHPKGLHKYKHRETRNYAHLLADSSAVECRDAIRASRSMERTWGKAMDERLNSRMERSI